MSSSLHAMFDELQAAANMNWLYQTPPDATSYVVDITKKMAMVNDEDTLRSRLCAYPRS